MSSLAGNFTILKAKKIYLKKCPWTFMYFQVFNPAEKTFSFSSFLKFFPGGRFGLPGSGSGFFVTV